MTVLLSAVAGLLIGWVASLVLHRETSQDISLDMLLGSAGAVLGTVVLNTGSMFDGLLSGLLSASLLLIFLEMSRRVLN
jgi:uncharacterized membrane protein YeaQ/YmgE (transglycosylase-associated protein family)